MSENKFGFVFLVNTLLGSGFFLLPGLAAGAGSGGYLIPLLGMPVIMYAVLLLYELSMLDFKGKLKTALKVIYSVICIVAASCAMALASLICIDVMLPGTSHVLLVGAFSLVIFIATGSKNSIQGLNRVFFLCLAVLLLSMLMTLGEIRPQRLAPTVRSPMSTLASVAPFFAGIIAVPYLARRGAKKRRITGAVVFSCIAYAALCAISIGVLGYECVSGEKYSLYVTIKSGELLLDARMLLASTAFSLVLLKPSVNLAYTAIDTLGSGKWMRAVMVLSMFILATVLESLIGAAF
ncbi:MAG: hypothetical protein IKK58_01170 [Clostridia bacterium]|nr:hypothetical protein [Clostridia bacterium]